MINEPDDLAQLQRNRLRAQADMFAAVAAHGTIVGTAREIALAEFFRGLVPKRFEVLSGAIAETKRNQIERASGQLDILVVDTFEYPTLLRAGDLAVVLPSSVRVIVEAKSDLRKGQPFFDALQQICRARSFGAGPLTALFCFGAPKSSATLRRWLEEMLVHRRQLISWARAPDQSRPAEYASASKKELLATASMLSPAYLPDLILADEGAIAIRADAGGKTSYEFYVTNDGAPSIVALASSVLTHVAESLVEAGSAEADNTGRDEAFRLLIEHFQMAFDRDDKIPSLDVTDEPLSIGGD